MDRSNDVEMSSNGKTSTAISVNRGVYVSHL